jgi:tetratricopeptide (TPR) repeat protein
MLPPFKTILVPTLVLSTPSRDMAALAAGFVEDLALLMNRLGDVRVRTGVRDPEDTSDPSQPRTASHTTASVDRLLAAERGDLVVIGKLTVMTDALSVQVELKTPGGETTWVERAELAEGLVRDARLVLAANLIEAATGQRKDVRRARLGGTQDFEAYKHVCLARFPDLPADKRKSLLEEALRIDPEYAEAQLLLTDVFEKEGRREEARALLAQVARRFPRFSWARQRYGVSLRVAGYAAEAVAEVQAALDTDPDGMTLFHAGLFAEAGGDPRTAATLYQRAVERGCIAPVLCDKLGRLRANSGRPVEAIELWERARFLDPDLEHVIGNLALAEHHAGNAPRAEALFVQAQELAPEVFTTHANRAVWLQDLGRHVDALEACTRALTIRPDSALMFNNRGVSRLALGDRTGARRDFEDALEHDPGQELGTYIRANVARLARGNARVDEAGRLLAKGARLVCDEASREAVPLLLEALDLYPESLHSWLMLALAYRGERQWEQQADALAQVLRLDPRHADALSERALALLALGRNEEAADHVRLALEVNGDDPGIVCNLGLVEMERGHYEQAQTAFDRAHGLDPSDPVVDQCLRELKKRRRKDPHWGEDWRPERV